MVGSFHESSSSASWYAAMFCHVSRHHAHHQFMLWGCQPVQFCWSWPDDYLRSTINDSIQEPNRIRTLLFYIVFLSSIGDQYPISKQTHINATTNTGNWMSECFLHNGSSWRIFIWSFETQHITQQMSSGFLPFFNHFWCKKNSLRSRVGQQKNWLLIPEGMTSQSSWVGYDFL